jgi:undecaprenyl-diphosphatase
MQAETGIFKRKLSWALSALFVASVIGLLLFRAHLSSLLHPAYALAAGLVQAANSFDYHIIFFLNKFAHRSWSFDTFFFLIDSNSLAAAPLYVAIWWAWFKEDENISRNREFLLYGIIGSFIAVFAARLLAVALPFRERPLRNPLLHFVLPYGVRPERLLGWSSFPSDHGALWFTLAATMLFVSRRTGIFLLVYVSCTLCVARVYLGIHYPLDILAGGLLGLAVASLARYPAMRAALTARPLKWLQKKPQLFYAVFFLFTAQMTEGFASTLEFKEYFLAIARAVIKLL